ncbi:rhomboid family intramembrane serine protease [Sporolactobacillus putidus]|uniref:Rhomboid protease YdcA n=1 Tax=Sporolactobacillus putidus TaxID=492735 RepID=A0A917S2E0_9BACL|nr:rhomboid family intramembrane serine protease [Sporolactobacillus putidus]GGL52945.1 putative rhomboid protease YdcA [Sporolactobacillus putidus]
MFIRNEPFKFFLKQYPVTSLILAVDIAVYLMLLITGTWKTAPFFAYQIFQSLVGSNAAIMQGAWWELITPIFLHITFSHILFNAFSILIFAPALEAMLGRWRFLIAFLGTGIISNVAALFLESPGFSHYGASAAVFGLLGIYLYLTIFRGYLVSRQDRMVIIVMIIIGMISSFADPNVDVLGHFTGFLSGFLLGPVLFMNAPTR